MKDEITKAIDKMQGRLQEVLTEASDLKKAINVMRKTIGLEALYQEEIEEVKTQSFSLRPDEYYGMPLATAVKNILRAKKQATSAQEILDQLETGGFDFDTAGWKKNLRLKNLAISLSKNRADFVPVPVNNENYYGLWEFYPEKKKDKNKKKVSNDTNDQMENTEVGEETNNNDEEKEN